MGKAATLKALIHARKLLVMPGAYDPVSARLIQEAGFDAVQCTGFAISAVHLGLPDYSMLSMTDMVSVTRCIASSVTVPVMADGDTGFGNAVNTFVAVQAFEEAGAAGVNIEDQPLPKRCGHLDGKQVVTIEEAVAKIKAASEARRDPDFVINARTDSLATDGIEEVVRRGNAYLEAGATMIFVDGATSRDVIETAVRRIRGPVSVNLVSGGKSPADLGLKELEEIGVARVSLPITPFCAAIQGMQTVLRSVMATGGLSESAGLVADFSVAQSVSGFPRIFELERAYLEPLKVGEKSDLN